MKNWLPPVSLPACAIDSAGTSLSLRGLQSFPSRGAARAAIRAALQPPAYHAPFTDVLAGADGTVWLREHASDRWDAHTRDGRLAGRVSLPRGARLVHADEGTIWVAIPQAGGAPATQVLVRYHIVRS